MERPTESRNPRAKNLSALPTREILELLNDEDATVPAAVRGAIPAIERAVDLVVPALREGHRLLYLGAGTSGRMAMLDASELPPTYGIDASLVRVLMAGGERAYFAAAEGAEDDDPRRDQAGLTWLATSAARPSLAACSARAASGSRLRS